MTGINKDILLAILAYVILLMVSFSASIMAGFGEAESQHDPTSVWLYVRRLMMVGFAVGLPLISGKRGIAYFGWKISGKWIAISAVLGVLIGFGNKGGFDPYKASAILVACFHALATEIFFRAYLIKTLSESLKSFWAPVVVSSILFGVFYLTTWTVWNQPGGIRIIFVCLFTTLGIIFGYCYKKSGSFLVPWLIHFLGVLRYRELINTFY